MYMYMFHCEEHNTAIVQFEANLPHRYIEKYVIQYTVTGMKPNAYITA